MNNLKLKKLQIAQYILLEKLNEICIDNDINYFLYAGSLLGAIRHKGMIPWDLDIDTAMLRTDYEKFINIFKESEEVFLQNDHTDKYSNRNFSRLMLKDTKISTKYNQNIKSKKNIYIDIFPIDDVSNLKTMKIKEVLIRSLQQAKAFKNGKRRCLKFTHTILNYVIGVTLFPLSNKVINSSINRLCKSEVNEKSKYVTNYFSHYGSIKELMEKSIYKETILVEFGRKKFPIPRKYKVYLEKIYGDYMTPPPEEKRIPLDLDLVEIEFGFWENVVEEKLNEK